jgi:hypothetical protein
MCEWSLTPSAPHFSASAARNLNCWSERLRKKANSEPITKHAIGTVRSVPRFSELTSRSPECDSFSSNCKKSGLTLPLKEDENGKTARIDSHALDDRPVFPAPGTGEGQEGGGNLNSSFSAVSIPNRVI